MKLQTPQESLHGETLPPDLGEEERLAGEHEGRRPAVEESRQGVPEPAALLLSRRPRGEEQRGGEGPGGVDELETGVLGPVARLYPLHEVEEGGTGPAHDGEETLGPAVEGTGTNDGK